MLLKLESAIGGDTVLFVNQRAGSEADFLLDELRYRGFRVVSADSVPGVFEVVQRTPPALSIVYLPICIDAGQLQLIGELRTVPELIAAPLIALAMNADASAKVAVLSAGADDIQNEPIDGDELCARMEALIGRTKEAVEIHPDTGLPGNSRIYREICARVASTDDLALCHVDIDRFKSVVDCYGPHRARLWLKALAGALRGAAQSVGQPTPFVGHIGGDDFVVLCHRDQLKALTIKAVVDFESATDDLYDAESAQRGYLLMVDHSGKAHPVNLVTLSIGVTVTTSTDLLSIQDVLAAMSEMKNVAKNHPGSWVAVAAGVAAR